MQAQLISLPDMLVPLTPGTVSPGSQCMCHDDSVGPPMVFLLPLDPRQVRLPTGKVSVQASRCMPPQAAFWDGQSVPWTRPKYFIYQPPNTAQ